MTVGEKRGTPPKPFLAIGPDGTHHKARGLSAFAEKHGLSYTSVSKCLNGSSDQVKGWRFFPPPEDADLSEYETVERTPKPKPESTEPPPGTPRTLPGLSNHAGYLLRAILDDDKRTPKQKLLDMYDVAAKVTIGVMEGGEPPEHWKLTQIRAFLKSYAEQHGIDPENIGDHSTTEDIAKQGALQLFRMGPLSILEMTDEVLDAMEHNMNRAEENAEQFVSDLGGMRAEELVRDPGTLPPGVDPGGPVDPKVVAAAAREWVVRIRRVKELARRARERCDPEAPERTRRIQAMSHMLRFMVYVGRSGVKLTARPQELVFTVGMIHTKAVGGIYLARHGYQLTPQGLLCPGDKYYDDRGKHSVATEQHWSGVCVMLPPRHGKTAIGYTDMVLGINEYPRIQMAVVHDNEVAVQNIMSSVRTHFDKDTDTGRRNHRLFPYELAKNDNNTHSVRVKQPDPPKSPNLIAASLWGSRLGGDLHRCYGDDLVPESDARESTRRAARFGAYHGVWSTRDMGSVNAYAIMLGYPHHHQDLLWSTYQEARRYAETNGKEGKAWLSVRVPVGGPKATDTMPAFKPVFPELYPERFLRNKYRSMGSRYQWASYYQLDPMPDDMRIVERLGFYEVGSSQAERALDRGEHHLSIDPTSTDKSTSDKVGLIEACVTDYGSTESSEGQRVIMLTGEDEFLSTQPALVEKITELSKGRRISRDYAHTHIETQGIGQPLVDFMEHQHGFRNIVSHTMPGSMGKKEARFRAFASLIDNTDPANSPAKVLLPGVRPVDENGDPMVNAPLEIAPGWDRLANYILNFKTETGFHSLDALIQLIRWCHETGRVMMGDGGEARRNAEPAVPEGVDSRKMRYYAGNSGRRRRHRGGNIMGATHGV